MKKDESDKMPAYDICIIGGGINGCGIARELSAKGYQVFLAEKNDISSGTSSWSTKLIHGGLRYLEYYEFRLVREALRERETLMQMAPHLIHPLRFVLPHLPSMRPKWLLRLGLFLYDHLGKRQFLKGSSSVNLKTNEAGQILRADLTYGFEYSDCFVDDNRLTIANAVAAKTYGAEIRSRCGVTEVNFNPETGWQVKTEDGIISAKLVINAAGPWVDQLRSLTGRKANQQSIRLVRGSHILTKRLFDHDKAYIFQNSDGRILFAIPYLDEFTLLGTTDVDHENTPDKPEISNDEISYICREVSAYLKQAVTPSDVVATYSGVRPLYDDGAEDAKAATRDYVLKFEEGLGGDWLNIFGGKLTTYRQLGLSVARLIEQKIAPPSAQIAGTSPLPGGDIEQANFDRFLAKLLREFPDKDAKQIKRMAMAYGTKIYTILGTADKRLDQGQEFGAGLWQAEVDYLIECEWAKTADDILLRRSKLGYFVTDKMRKELESYLVSHPLLKG